MFRLIDCWDNVLFTQAIKELFNFEYPKYQLTEQQAESLVLMLQTRAHTPLWCYSAIPNFETAKNYLLRILLHNANTIAIAYLNVTNFTDSDNIKEIRKNFIQPMENNPTETSRTAVINESDNIANLNVYNDILNDNIDKFINELWDIVKIYF